MRWELVGFTEYSRKPENHDRESAETQSRFGSAKQFRNLATPQHPPTELHAVRAHKSSGDHTFTLERTRPDCLPGAAIHSWRTGLEIRSSCAAASGSARPTCCSRSAVRSSPTIRATHGEPL